MPETFETAPTRSVDVNDTSFVCREIGDQAGTPVVFLHHLTAVLDDWDPKIVDAVASEHKVIIFDNRGVGASGGTTPDNVDDMATDAVAFLAALGLSKVDLFGFSMGGFIAQVIAQKHPQLVRRLILAGTSAQGGEGIRDMGAVLQQAVARAAAENKHPKQHLFFTASDAGQRAAAEFLQRLDARKQDRDTPATNETIVAHVTAITKWGMSPSPASLAGILQPTLVVNGDADVMAPSVNTIELAHKIPGAKLSIFPDAGHGAIFQYHHAFAEQALAFLQD